MATLKFRKATALPGTPVAHTVYLIKGASDTRVKGYITDGAGVAFPLSDADLSVAMISALSGAASPSGLNVFATMADVATNTSAPLRQVFTYSTSNLFNLAYSGVKAIYVALNGQVLEEGPAYDWVVAGSQLEVTAPLTAGDEISILYHVAVPRIATLGGNLDGGAPDSVYLPIQNVDGGTP